MEFFNRVSRLAILTAAVFAGSVSVASAQSCTNCQPGVHEQQGTIGGALLGSAIGSMFGGNDSQRAVGGLLGGVVGGAIGNRIGAQLDEADRQSLERVTQEALTTGKPAKFANKKSGVRGTVTVTASATNAQGQQCRSANQEVVLQDGTVAKETVKACKGPNGWSAT